ncbi:MAG: Rieske (2Fe-2S) protein [Thaumarchaeota archaeon]|nr:Rieske (2Fe-2S) protein [Nitrososphaerota archaeon]
MNRREFIRSFVVTAALVATAAAGFVELGGLAEKNQNGSNTISLIQQTTSQSIAGSTNTVSSSQLGSSVSTPTGYVLLAPLADLTGKTFAYFTHPTFGSSILVNTGGVWKAFSSTCTHRPCTVQYQSSAVYCPCHGGTFSPVDGSVTGGPPPTPLPEYSVLIQNNNVYVGNTVIN